MNRLRIGYTCNVRDTSRAADERYNEWEPPETVEAVATALIDAGCEVSVIDVGPDIFHVLECRRSELHLVFNNAEGLEEGELREAIVPFFCEQLGIPHTGSSPKTFINTMDKATAKSLVAYDGVATPRFQIMRRPGDPLLPGLAFPLMVKPDSEGTSIGITQASKVHDDRGLRAQVERILDACRQPALVEEFMVILTGGMSVDAAPAEGRRLRYDRALGATLGHPGGLHVNFVQVSRDGSLDVLTYEAGRGRGPAADSCCRPYPAAPEFGSASSLSCAPAGDGRLRSSDSWRSWTTSSSRLLAVVGSCVILVLTLAWYMSDDSVRRPGTRARCPCQERGTSATAARHARPEPPDPGRWSAVE